MKTLLKLFIMTITGISLYSCDNREADIAPLNSAPEVFFLGQNQKTSFQDTVKISLKSPDKSSEFQINFTDKNKNLKEVKFEIDGKGKFSQDGKDVSNNLNITGGKNLLRFDPSEVGLHKISFTASDKAGKSSKAEAFIYAFDNLKPVAKIKATAVKVLSPYEYELDGSGSYDSDVKYGGSIVLYTFSVNGRKIVETDKSKIKYIFPEPGNYTIEVTVKDIDGSVDTDSKQITVN
jgi:hypothetical protein